MKRTAYTYSVIKYVHDPAAGESLNIGVVLWSPAVHWLGWCFEKRFERLSGTFAGFDGENYKRSLGQFETALGVQAQDLAPALFSLNELPGDISGILSKIWPDPDLSFCFGPVLAGITDDPEQALSEIFYRMVVSQNPSQGKLRRSDEQVWTKVYQKPLVDVHVSKKLKPWTITTEAVNLRFDRAFKNEKWQVIEAVSMDYKDAGSIQRRAVTLLGNAVALEDVKELGTLYLLLGEPEKEENLKAYTKAKNLLHKMPIRHELIEENQAEEFARHIADYMRQHGLMDDDE